MTIMSDTSTSALFWQCPFCPHFSQPPQQKTVTLERGPEGLGFSIVGGHGSPHGDLPIYVKNVFAKGAAADNGQLRRGDQILSVNGHNLDGVTHEEAVNILKNARGKVTLVILSWRKSIWLLKTLTEDTAATNSQTAESENFR